MKQRGIKRRRWLKQAVRASAVIPALVPASVIGAKDKKPPSDRITFGMIGTGRQTYYRNLPQLLASKEAQVVAVCDVDKWRLQNAKKKTEDHYAKAGGGSYKGCKAVVDYREVLSNPKIDAVMIATPDHWHTTMTLEAFKAGKDVSLEKPITRSIGEGRAIIKAAEKYKCIFRVDSEFRSLSNFHRAAELIRNGCIGKVKRVEVGVPRGDVGCPPQNPMPVPEDLDYDRWLGSAEKKPYTQKRVHPPRSYGRPGWMRCLDYCDGMITNWGSHLNDVAMWSAKKETTSPVKVRATGTYPPKESFWNVLLTFDAAYEFADGLIWQYKIEKPSIRLEGEKGWIYCEYSNRAIRASDPRLLKTELAPDAIRFPMRSDKADFIHGVKTRTKTMENEGVGHRVQTLCLLANIAIKVGRELRYDPEAEKFIDAPDADKWLDAPITTPVHRKAAEK